MDWLKNFINTFTPKDNIFGEIYTGNTPTTPTNETTSPAAVTAPKIDLSAPENTGFRNLLATVNQYRDPETLQIDPRRMKDNMSFEGMDKQPFDLAPRIEMMPEQIARIPGKTTEADRPAVIQKPKIEQTKGSLTPKEKPIEQKITDPVVQEKIQQEMDILSKLGLSTTKTDVDQEMLDAQEAVRKNRLLQGLGKAAEKIGTSIAGVQSDASFAEHLKDMVEQPVAQLKEVRASAAEKEKRIMDKSKFAIDMEKSGIDLEKAKLDMADESKKRDPNSELSKAMRNFVREQAGQVGLKLGINDSFSYAQLEKLNGSLTNLFNTKMAQDARRDLAKENALIRAQATKDKQEIKNADVALKLNKQVDDIDNKIGLTEAKDALMTLESYRYEPADPAMDIATLYKFIKVLDPGSVVREGEIHLTKQGQSLFENMGVSINRISNGQIISQKLKKDIINTIGRIYNTRQETYKNKVSGIVNAADKQNLDKDIIFGNNRDVAEGTFIAPSTYSAKEESGIQAVMKANNITRDEAIQALKEAGKIK